MGKGESRGPQAPGPWGTTGEIDRGAPWGVSEDSPMDEGSETTAVTEGRRGERRAAGPDEERGPELGPAEPTRTPEAGPGAPPDPAPAVRPFPDESEPADVGDNPVEEATGMRPEGAIRDE